MNKWNDHSVLRAVLGAPGCARPHTWLCAWCSVRPGNKDEVKRAQKEESNIMRKVDGGEAIGTRGDCGEVETPMPHLKTKLLLGSSQLWPQQATSSRLSDLPLVQKKLEIRFFNVQSPYF